MGVKELVTIGNSLYGKSSSQHNSYSDIGFMAAADGTNILYEDVSGAIMSSQYCAELLDDGMLKVQLAS